MLDPTVDAAALAGLGGGGMTSAWDLATTALSDADRLWYVRPDSSLERIDGFAGGRDIWLGGFFQLASSPAPAELRLADAVATAGLTAGAAPRRRAVVLVLASGQSADTSRFSVAQVRSYLAEIGVPLQVIRTERGPLGRLADGRRGGFSRWVRGCPRRHQGPDRCSMRRVVSRPAGAAADRGVAPSRRRGCGAERQR